MSFILDALKKSETERQEQSTAEFSNVPVSSGGANPARWLWLLAALLLVNVAILLGILLKPGDGPAMQPSAAIATAQQVPAPVPVQKSAPSFDDQVARVITERPPERLVTQPEPLPYDPPATTTPATATRHAPTLDQLRLNGAINLPELHLDIHVFSENPADRFVFINMNKHREGTRIEAGPLIKEITPDGVILQHQGQTFLLPRE
jgi:general secretion pathway protein B